MPRAFDSDEHAHTGGPLRFVENVDCPACDQVFEAWFVDDSASVQDIVDPPVGEHVCPRCAHPFRTALTGWCFYSEAG